MCIAAWSTRHKTLSLKWVIVVALQMNCKFLFNLNAKRIEWVILVCHIWMPFVKNARLSKLVCKHVLFPHHIHVQTGALDEEDRQRFVFDILTFYKTQCVPFQDQPSMFLKCWSDFCWGCSCCGWRGPKARAFQLMRRLFAGWPENTTPVHNNGALAENKVLGR